MSGKEYYQKVASYYDEDVSLGKYPQQRFTEAALAGLQPEWDELVSINVDEASATVEIVSDCRDAETLKDIVYEQMVSQLGILDPDIEIDFCA